MVQTNLSRTGQREPRIGIYVPSWESNQLGWVVYCLEPNSRVAGKAANDFSGRIMKHPDIANQFSQA